MNTISEISTNTTTSTESSHDITEINTHNVDIVDESSRISVDITNKT